MRLPIKTLMIFGKLCHIANKKMKRLHGSFNTYPDGRVRILVDVDSHDNEEELMGTIWHEGAHALASRLNLGLSKKHEESIIANLETYTTENFILIPKEEEERETDVWR